MKITLLRKIKTFLQDPWTLGIKIMKHTCRFWPDATYLKLYYFFRTKKTLHLKNPRTFNEKLQWLKLFDRKSEYTFMVDKYEVKSIVEKLIGKEYVIPTIALYETVNDIKWEKLPQKFVIKTTNGGGSGGVIVCKNKNKLNINAAKKKLQKSYNRNIYNDLKEWPYKNVKSRIIAEELLEDSSHGELYDYKVLCFNGLAKLIQVHKGRDNHHTLDFYDISWVKQDAFIQPPYLPSKEIAPKPNVLEDMLRKSEILASEIPFVRVDWYIVNNKMYFGELTFYDGSGFHEFEPDQYNELFGKWIVLPALSAN